MITVWLIQYILFQLHVALLKPIMFLELPESTGASPLYVGAFIFFKNISPFISNYYWQYLEQKCLVAEVQITNIQSIFHCVFQVSIDIPFESL